MSQRVRVRRLTDEEGRQLQRIVRRGGGQTQVSVVRYRRAMVVLASAGGNTVEVIARLGADVRGHLGGRPRLVAQLSVSERWMATTSWRSPRPNLALRLSTTFVALNCHPYFAESCCSAVGADGRPRALWPTDRSDEIARAARPDLRPLRHVRLRRRRARSVVDRRGLGVPTVLAVDTGG